MHFPGHVTKSFRTADEGLVCVSYTDVACIPGQAYSPAMEPRIVSLKHTSFPLLFLPQLAFTCEHLSLGFLVIINVETAHTEARMVNSLP
jgi:hypothetical protein